MRLSENIDNAIECIAQVQSYFGQDGRNSIPTTLTHQVESKCTYVLRTLERARKCIPIRDHAEGMLENLISRVDRGTNEVECNGQNMPFNIARILTFQSYTGITWITYDLIIESLNYFICSSSYNSRNSSHPRLVKTFLKPQGENIRAIDAKIVIGAYGWPIGISYCIRNVFAHESDVLHDGDIFEGNDVDSEYTITEQLHNYIKRKCIEYNVNDQYTRHNDPWPWGDNDLFKILKICNEEIDEAMIGLLTWTSKGFEQLAGALSARDRQ